MQDKNKEVIEAEVVKPVIEETTPKPEPSLKELLIEVKNNQEKLVQEKKVKSWKLPFGSRVSTGQAKKNWATFQLIHDNKNIEFIKTQIVDGTAQIEGLPRIATADYCLMHKNRPFYIINMQSLKPYSVNDDLKQADDLKMTAIAGRKLVLARLQKEAIKPTGKGFGMIGWIVLGAIVLGVGYYLMKGGKLF